MKITSFFTVLVLLIGIAGIQAQELGCAVGIQHEDSPEDLLFFNALLQQIGKLGNSKIVVYDWNEQKRSMQLNSTLNTAEKPAEIVIFIKQHNTTPVNYQPPVKTAIDTTGVVFLASMSLDFNMSYTIKVVDLKTGKVEDILKPLNSKGIGLPQPPIQIRDFKKYFGNTPLKSISKKQYQAILNRLWKDYAQQIKNRYKKLAEQQLPIIKTVTKAISQYSDMGVYTYSVDDINADKISNITINTGQNTGTIVGQDFWLYRSVDIEGKAYPVYVGRVYAKTVEGEQALCKKLGFLSAKKFAQKLRDYPDIIIVKNKIALRSVFAETMDENINISIDNNDCLLCSYGLQADIVKSLSVNLIERADTELQQLRKLYIDDRFIDYDLSSFQDKQLGVQYLLSFENSSLSLTDVATGGLVSVDKKTGRKNWLIPGYSNTEAWKMTLLSVGGKKIQPTKVIKEKRNKIQKIELFHPFGFDAGSKFDISISSTETIKGVAYERKIYIASGYVVPSKESANFGIMGVNDGEAELYDAINNDKPLVISYAVKRS